MLSISETAKATGIAPYRIKYALETKAIPEPGRLAGRRCFTPEDVERVRRHFAAGRRADGGREGRRGKEAF